MGCEGGWGCILFGLSEKLLLSSGMSRGIRFPAFTLSFLWDRVTFELFDEVTIVE